MKTELGLDERDPSCFLRTYSVIMVLRKVRGELALGTWLPSSPLAPWSHFQGQALVWGGG